MSEDVAGRHNTGLKRGLALALALAGPLAWCAALVLPAPAGLGEPAWQVAGLALWMACWWIAQPVPLAATALPDSVASIPGDPHDLLPAR